MDETTLTLHPPLRACWMRRGQQKLVPAPGTPESHHLFAAYDWETDKLIWTTSARKNSQAFVTFLEELLVQRSVLTSLPLSWLMRSAGAKPNRL